MNKSHLLTEVALTVGSEYHVKMVGIQEISISRIGNRTQDSLISCKKAK